MVAKKQGIIFYVIVISVIPLVTGINALTGSDDFDPANWTKAPVAGAVLDVGSSGAWDSNRVIPSTILKEGPVYKLWYWREDSSTSGVGYATSFDGVSWSKYGSNPLSRGRLPVNHTWQLR